MDPRLGLAVLVGVCLLQLPAMLVLARRLELGAELPWRPGYASTPMDRPASVPGICPDCGAANTPAFTYCRRCVARL